MATDYVLRVLYGRLSDSINALATLLAAAGGAEIPEYTTVADMLAADVTEIKSFARCANAVGADGIKSLWMRSSDTNDNDTDNRQSTFHPAFFYQRVWVKEP